VAITGNWHGRTATQAGPRQLGTGWNPVHAQRTGDGRNTAPQGNTGWVDPSLEETTYDYGYDDALTTEVYGYGPDTGTSDHPGWGEPEKQVEGFPSWGEYQAGLPGGTQIRSQDHGAEASYVSRNPVELSAMAGWQNKMHGDVTVPITSDPSQYEVTTSMRQLNASRQGSQSSGRASEYNSPIGSRIVGMKVREMTGDPQRWWAMQPKEQIMRIRPWWARQAGTGIRSWMRPNDVLHIAPMVRQPPSIPDQGITVGSNSTGWTDEDGGWY
jgi:hypothetical protein